MPEPPDDDRKPTDAEIYDDHTKLMGIAFHRDCSSGNAGPKYSCS
jgi:hypothetical protein